MRPPSQGAAVFNRGGLRTLEEKEGVTYGLGLSQARLSKATNRR